MLLQVVKMLKKKLGINAIESDWSLHRYFKISSTLIISEECVRIGWSSFWRCERLKKVIIPESVKRIGFVAFRDCWNATIILKKRREDFEFLASDAFNGCKDVKEEVGS